MIERQGLVFARSNQERVGQFVELHSLDALVDARLLDLVSEVGELSKEFLIATSYGQKEFQPSAEWRDELGDVYFALLCVAEKSGVDLDTVLRESMAKYERRLKTTGGPDVRRSRDL
jgi:NTP pyrophosphatase (non-canonical NTP hydrolase)